MGQPLAIVTSQWPIVPTGIYGRMNIFAYFPLHFPTPMFQHGASLVSVMSKMNPLTLSLQGLSYPGLNWSRSWLLMPWLLVSPGHQQSWYWLCETGRTLFYMRKDLNYYVLSVWRKDMICRYIFMFPMNILACKGLRTNDINTSHGLDNMLMN